MEDNPEIFPQSNPQYVLNKIKEGAALFPSVNDFAVSLIRTLDKNGSGFVDLDQFKSGISENKIYLTDHEEHTIIRHFDSTNTG
jgi:Ca2+-binding EF-hand superfamily protein